MSAFNSRLFAFAAPRSCVNLRKLRIKARLSGLRQRKNLPFEAIPKQIFLGFKVVVRLEVHPVDDLHLIGVPHLCLVARSPRAMPFRNVFNP